MRGGAISDKPKDAHTQVRDNTEGQTMAKTDETKPAGDLSPEAANALVKADMRKRILGAVRFGPGKDWLKEAAEASADKRVEKLLEQLSPADIQSAAKYIGLL